MNTYSDVIKNWLIEVNGSSAVRFGAGLIETITSGQLAKYLSIYPLY